MGKCTKIDRENLCNLPIDNITVRGVSSRTDRNKKRAAALLTNTTVSL